MGVHVNMKNFNVKIFETYIKDEAHSRIREELKNNPNFQINDNNITEFVDCKSVLDLLKKHKIEYKIISKDNWTTTGRIPQYDLIVCIYISQKDYVSIKHFFEPVNEVEYEEYDAKNDKITKNINMVGIIIKNFLICIIAIVFIGLGIQLINDDKVFAIVFLIISGGILLFRIIKIIKFLNKKFKKRL